MSSYRSWLVRVSGATALLVGIISGIFGCTRPDDADDTTITWYAGSVDQSKNDFRQILVNEFERAHPSINVKLVFGPTNTDDMRDELTGKLKSADDAPDVYLGDVIWPAEFAESGLALDLESVFGADFWKRFPSELLDAARYRDRVYAAPFFVDQGMLYYWSGLGEPPTTWDQLVVKARELKTQRKVDWGYVWQGKGYEGLTCNWIEILADKGGSTLDDSGTMSRINSLQALDALNFLHGLIKDGITPPQVTEYQEPDSTALFLSGRAAYLRGWNGLSSYIQANRPAAGFKLGEVKVAPLPTFQDQKVQNGPEESGGYSAVGGWSMFVNPKTQKLNEVSKFVDWMTNVDAQRIMARLAKIPTNVQVRQDNSTQSEDAVRVGMKTHPVARPSTTPLYPKVSEAVYSNVNAALVNAALKGEGGMTPEAALQEADRQITSILRETTGKPVSPEPS